MEREERHEDDPVPRRGPKNRVMKGFDNQEISKNLEVARRAVNGNQVRNQDH